MIKLLSRLLFVTVLAELWPAKPSLAQTRSNPPTMGNVAQDFKIGANCVGDGAVQIGGGTKQVAITRCEAIKDGAASLAASFIRRPTIVLRSGGL